MLSVQFLVRLRLSPKQKHRNDKHAIYLCLHLDMICMCSLILKSFFYKVDYCTHLLHTQANTVEYSFFNSEI